jgi:hypothetical protein
MEASLLVSFDGEIRSPGAPRARLERRRAARTGMIGFLARVGVLSLLAHLGAVDACSIDTGIIEFTPAAGSSAAASAAALPAPEVTLTSLQRGIGSDDGSCRYLGSIGLRLHWPAAHAARLAEIGFRFRVVAGTAPAGLLPDHPVQRASEGDHVDFAFVWADGDPSAQAPLDFEVEVVAVDGHLRYGAPARFRVVHPYPTRSEEP